MPKLRMLKNEDSVGSHELQSRLRQEKSASFRTTKAKTPEAQMKCCKAGGNAGAKAKARIAKKYQLDTALDEVCAARGYIDVPRRFIEELFRELS